MAFGERSDRFGGVSARRRRVLEQAEREQVRESQAARERLLRHAAGCRADRPIAA